MGLFDRLKRLWALSAEPEVGGLDLNLLQSTWPDTNAAIVRVPTVATTGEVQGREVVLKPRGPATIVEMETPFDGFDGPKDAEHEGDLN